MRHIQYDTQQLSNDIKETLRKLRETPAIMDDEQLMKLAGTETVHIVVTEVTRKGSNVVRYKEHHTIISHPSTDSMVTVALACQWYPF